MYTNPNIPYNYNYYYYYYLLNNYFSPSPSSGCHGEHLTDPVPLPILCNAD